MESRSVLISGAGIAGSTLGYLLAERGFRVSIVERGGEIRSSGTPVDVQGEAFDVAEKMGIVPRLRAAATRVDCMAFVDESGRRRAQLNLPVNSSRQIEIPRKDLARIVCESAQTKAQVLFDESVVSIEQDSDGVDVAFERSPSRRFDYVVGCDGLHSTVRRIVFGPEKSFIHDLGLYVATFPLPMAAESEHEVLLYNAPNKALSIHPGTGKAIAALMFRGHVADDFDYRDLDLHRQILEREFCDVGWRSDEILGFLRKAQDFYFDSVSSVRLTTWSKGRVTLLGDAASCVSFLGGGSSNAMAGAAVLASALSNGDHADAFRAYEREHRKTVDSKQRGVGLASRFLIPATTPGIVARNMAVSAWSAVAALRS